MFIDKTCVHFCNAGAPNERHLTRRSAVQGHLRICHGFVTSRREVRPNCDHAIACGTIVRLDAAVLASQLETISRLHYYSVGRHGFRLRTSGGDQYIVLVRPSCCPLAQDGRQKIRGIEKTDAWPRRADETNLVRPPPPPPPCRSPPQRCRAHQTRPGR